MFIGAWINGLAPWLIGIGGMLGMILSVGLLYLRRRPEDQDDPNRLDPPVRCDRPDAS